MARWGNGKLPWRGKGFREQIERYRCPAVGTDGLPREKLPSQRGGAGWITPTLKHHAQLPELQKLLGAFGNESRIRNPFAGSRGSFVSTVCSGLPLPSIVHITFPFIALQTPVTYGVGVSDCPGLLVWLSAQFATQYVFSRFPEFSARVPLAWSPEAFGHT